MLYKKPFKKITSRLKTSHLEPEVIVPRVPRLETAIWGSETAILEPNKQSFQGPRYVHLWISGSVFGMLSLAVVG